MKAIVHDRYGSFDLLELRDIAKPAIRDDEVLVRVEAAGLHIGDYFGVGGSPFAMRMVSGLIKPKRGVPGFDLAGHVEAVGRNVTHSSRGTRFSAYPAARVRNTRAPKPKLWR